MGLCFTVQMVNDPKQPVKATKDLLKEKKWRILQWPSHLTSTQFRFSVENKTEAERPTNKQQLKASTVKAWKSISREETQHLVMSMFSRLQAVIDCKGFSSKY